MTVLVASATIETGLAGVIAVNPAIDPTAGGNLDHIRDGITHEEAGEGRSFD